MENNNTSNTILIMGAILIVALVVGIIKVKNFNADIDELTERVTTLENKINGTGSDTTTDSYDTSVFKEITIADIEKESKGKTIVVWLGIPTCGYCQAYAPLLAEVADDYGITARYVDVAAMTQEDYDILVTLEGDDEYKGFGASFTGTPFTMIIKNGKVVGGINGYVETERIESAFEAAGLKK